MDPIIYAAISLLGGFGCLFMFHKDAKKRRDSKVMPEGSTWLYWLFAGLGLMLLSFILTSMHDDRPAIKYPIINRYDIRGQYEYVEEWEHPTTKCHYLIHHTRLSTGKMEMNRLENGKDDCPANR